MRRTAQPAHGWHRMSACLAGRWRRATSATRPVAVAMLGATLLLGGAGGVRGQSLGSVNGMVTSVDSSALAFAQVSVSGSGFSVTTGRDGRFHIENLPAGAALLEVTLLGYASAHQTVQVVAGRTVSVQVALAVDPVRLAPVAGNVAAGRSPEMRGFYDRRERGRGHFFTLDDIERLQPRLLTDLLRRVPGMRVEPLSGPTGTTESARTQRTSGIAGARGCPVLYFVNGMPFPLGPGMGINTYIRPEDVAGVEVYSGAAQLPPQFHVSQGNARCGLVVIWTRTGEKRAGG